MLSSETGCEESGKGWSISNDPSQVPLSGFEMAAIGEREEAGQRRGKGTGRCELLDVG